MLQVVSALAIALLPVLSVFVILVLIICIGERHLACTQQSPRVSSPALGVKLDSLREAAPFKLRTSNGDSGERVMTGSTGPMWEVFR